MAHTLSEQRVLQQYAVDRHTSTLWGRFIQWATAEDETHHLGWVGGALTIESCVLFPLTMLTILANGGTFGLIIVAMISLSTVVITNLAALSTRYTIPVFFASILVNAGVIIASFFS